MARLTPAIVEEVLDLRAGGATAGAIAEAIGNRWSQRTIEHVAHDARKRGDPRAVTCRTGRAGMQWTPEQDATLRRLAAAGERVSAIAAATGHSFDGARYRLRRLGLRIARRPAEPKPRKAPRFQPARPTLVWGAGRDAILRAMRDDEEPFSVIAGALGASRDACIGRAHRLGMCVNRKRKRPLPVAEREPPPQEPSRDRRRFAPLRALSLVDVATAPPEAVSLLDALPCHCRWIVGRNAGGIAMFCGGVVTGPTSSWCPTHRAVVYSRERAKQ